MDVEGVVEKACLKKEIGGEGGPCNLHGGKVAVLKSQVFGAEIRSFSSAVCEDKKGGGE